MGEETTIMGTVLSVVFQNEENGYAVLRLVTDDGELLTLVGCVPCAAPGENLTATGTFWHHMVEYSYSRLLVIHYIICLH